MTERLDENLAAEIKKEPKSAAAQQARKMGLTYGGFGRYLDKKGNVAYIVDRGKLVPFKGEEDVQKMYDKAYTASDPKKSKELEKDADKFTRVGERRRTQDERFFEKTSLQAYKVNDALIQAHEPMFDDMNDYYQQVLQAYTEESFEAINRYLYKGHDEGADARKDRDIVSQITALDDIIDQSEAPFSYTVYTGLSSRYTPEKIMTDQKYLFRGYLSTSLDPDVSISGFTSEDAKKRVVLQIEITAGQKALHVDGVSSNSGEMETLLPRGSMIHVVSGPHVVKPSFLGKSDEEEGDIYLFHCLLVQDEDE